MIDAPTFRRYANLRQWLRALLREWLHSATGTIIGGLSTNGIEGMAPDQVMGIAIKVHLEGIGLTLSQMGAIFFTTLFLTALRRVHQDTAPSQ